MDWTKAKRHGLFGARSCVVCGHGTDTAIGIEGEPEWYIAALMLLGIPALEAAAMVPTDADGRFRSAVMVCAACAKKARLPVKPTLYIVGAALPGYVQPY